ncbi:MAG TPA: hypothetical protein VMY77_08220 [Chitinophagaceae bacterium]|nr:hypothetical protein [Chitinophagaceae bacterium]
MEVHKHPHHVTHKKKWTEYLLEFFMLFLAVFLGFVAENYREHIAEHKREKEYLLSLTGDLKNDTAALNYSISRLQADIKYGDSLIIFFSKKNLNDSIKNKLSIFGVSSGLSVDVFFNDRTSSQLKGTGSMRLIRNKKVADQILQYWSNQLKIQQIHDRFENVRIEQRKVGYKTFSNWYFINYNASHRKDIISVNLSSMPTSDDKALNEFVNVTSTLNNVGITQYMPALQSQLSLAKEIISMIKKEYHLENE